MRIAYFDCFSGVSGDMILGAFVDAGLDLQVLKSELDKLHSPGLNLRAEKTTKRGIAGTKIHIDVQDSARHHLLRDLIEIVDGSQLPEDIKTSSKAIFTELATAEAKVHNTSIDTVHFHELGGLDTVIDVVGALVAAKLLGLQAAYSSLIPTSTGFVQVDHGKLPVPTPATLELLKGIPLRSSDIEGELVTPTGIAVLRRLCTSFGTMPQMRIATVGYGAGSKDFTIPNMLRICIGDTTANAYEQDEVLLIETNIDNMNPEFLGYTIERLLAQGALDVFMIPLYMKKNRPATLLSVLSAPDQLDCILSIIFEETTSLGIRIHRVERRKLIRETLSVTTRLGPIRIKVSKTGGEIRNVAPEYEDCRDIAIKHGLPLKEVYEEVQAAAKRAILAEKDSQEDAPHA